MSQNLPGLTPHTVVVLVGALGNGLDIGGVNGNRFEEHVNYVGKKRN